MNNIKYKIKTKDTVIVRSGSYKGKTGEVLAILTDRQRAIVKGINIVKKHQKPSSQNPQGRILEIESSIHISNLALVDPSAGKACRVGYKFKDGKKIRISKSSGTVI